MKQKEYLDGIRSGDKRILTDIYNMNLPKFINWVKQNSGSEEDAHDIFQDTMETIMIMCFEEDFEIKSSLNSLVMTISKNKWIDKIRKKKTEKKVRLELASRQEQNTSMDFDLNLTNDTSMVQQMLSSTFAKVSPLCQKLLTLIESGQTGDEVANQLDMSNANAVYRRKFACLAAWRKHIESHEYYETWKNSKS